MNPSPSNVLKTGQILKAGESLKASKHSYYLIMQGDGNLVLYVGDHFVPKNAIWSSGTHGKGQGPHYMVMQGDGNLVVYDCYDQPTWSSETHSKGAKGHWAAMQDDGNFVLYDGEAKPTWHTHTYREEIETKPTWHTHTYREEIKPYSLLLEEVKALYLCIDFTFRCYPFISQIKGRLSNFIKSKKT